MNIKLSNEVIARKAIIAKHLLIPLSGIIHLYAVGVGTLIVPGNLDWQEIWGNTLDLLSIWPVAAATLLAVIAFQAWVAILAYPNSNKTAGRWAITFTASFVMAVFLGFALRIVLYLAVVYL